MRDQEIQSGVALRFPPHSILARLLNRLIVADEFVQVAKLAPFADDEVAVLINRSSMRRIANANSPLIGRQTKISALLFIRIIAHLRGNVTRFVENGDAAL